MLLRLARLCLVWLELTISFGAQAVLVGLESGLVDFGKANSVFVEGWGGGGLVCWGRG